MNLNAPAKVVAGGRLPSEDELREISASLQGLRYGSVNIVVQDGVIIQIDRLEKKRLRNRRETSEPMRT
ncbi:MAG: YezD family protein [Pirellulales bacterium]|nr:YezD family protein [Pirellulales bacterium]